ncbi:MAG: L-threonine 3-dehydrogenase [Chloroflexota bacterium]
MLGKMKAIVKPRPGPGLEMATVDIPPIGPRDVLVKVRATSICGTDLHIYNWDAWAQSRIKTPLVLGHELAGDVVEVGDQVKLLKVGDYVSADSHVSDGVCYVCRNGQPHICQNLKILGVDTQGCFSEYAAIPEVCAWVNDKSLPPEVASVQEPLGNAVYTVLAEPITGKTVAVFGDGPAGLNATGVARASGASTIFLVGKHDFRLGIGKQMGASVVFNVQEPSSDVVRSILAATDGVGVDVVLEMTGNPQAIDQGFQVLRKGGRFSAFGIPSNPVELDLNNALIFKGARILGINGRLMWDTWYQMAGLLASGKLDPRPVITHQIRLEDYQEGFALMMSKERNVGKVVMFP